MGALSPSEVERLHGPAAWDRSVHLWDPSRPETQIRYCMVLDALNFCFWPDPGFQYDHLALALKVWGCRRGGGGGRVADAEAAVGGLLVWPV